MVYLKLRIPIITAVLFAAAPSVFADWRCDCTQVTASCSAAVTVEGNGIFVTSNTKQCSRVDYFVEGQPFVTVTVDGDAKEAWLPRTGRSEVLIQSCQVCRDNLLNPGSGPTTQMDLRASADDAPLVPDQGMAPTITFEPDYPADARARGQQGYVTVNVTVNAAGHVTSVNILEANPPNIFDNEAVDAVRRWRYPTRESGSEDVQREERVIFQLGRLSDAELTRTAAQQEGSRHNACIRAAQQGRVDDRFEVQLENVCNEPLIVHSCVEGVRDALGRWTCGPRGRGSTLLITTGDDRAGRSVTFHRQYGLETFVFAERLSLYRSGTSRYWWVACGFRDRSCNDAATRWQGAFHDRPVDLSPGNTTLAEASSAR